MPAAYKLNRTENDLFGLVWFGLVWFVYELELMNFGGKIKSPAYLAINPMGKVPAIKHGDTVVTEVVAICAYLADQFPEHKLAPALDSVLRGSYYRWLFFAAGPLEMAMTAEAYN